MFEPSSVGNPGLFREAWQLARVVKYSHERLHELPTDLEGRKGPRLHIETLGREGLRYRTRLPGCWGRAWQRLESVPAVRVMDTAGAGDWCTAGIVHRLFPTGASALEAATDTCVRDAVRYGQALAARTCGFEGPRGGMYDVEKQRFDEQVAAILGVSSGSEAETISRQASVENGVACLRASCEQPDVRATSPKRTSTQAGR